MPTKIVIQLNKDNATSYTVSGDKDFQGNDIPPYEVIDWVPALIAVCGEIDILNKYAISEDFPRPISNNPNAMIWQQLSDSVSGVDVLKYNSDGVPIFGWVGNPYGFVGDQNTWPITNDGMVEVLILNYDWINYKFLPQQPTTFSLIGGQPPHVTKFI